ncbi:MAG: FAD-dependent oxidoreductase [Deltaproteobacteria bacterium]|jgi:NADPH-dependent 2,4-dienoyl-CoA reductase/sulfur reductase-like enzyme/rhodanese-related sulfurtransferase|nr:FAD-dependent oxidoreductase [Deltaproteobacteria bacterium]
MPQNILVIGGVALGPKAACRCKRLLPDASVVMLDENPLISYGGCGIPYYMSGEVNNLDDLRATPYHTIRDPAFFAALKGVDARIQTRALSVDRQAKTVLTRNVATGTEETLPYDKLCIATGARPRMPEVAGHDLDGVFSITRLEAAERIRKACEQGEIKEAVIVGGGFIGLEAAVALADMWGVKTSVVEMLPHILSGALPAHMSHMARHDCESHEVAVYAPEKVVRLEGENGKVARVVTDKRILPAQLVIFAAGFIPNGRLAAEAGLACTPFGAILVNERMQTSDPDIYAGGDCVSVPHLITGKPGYFPLGSMANRQGRVIGANLAGGSARFPGAVGAWAVKLFTLCFCGTGLSLERAEAEGFDAVSVGVEQLDRAHFYPEKDMMHLELVVERAGRRVLGAQGASASPDVVKARIDAISGVLQYARPTADEISNLEVAYAPPFASAMDIVNVAGNVADNVLAGRGRGQSVMEFMEAWRGRKENGIFFADARPSGGSAQLAEAYPDEWHAVPLEEMERRAGEFPKDRPVFLICNTGLRAYDAQLVLARRGIASVNAFGGMQAALKAGLKP